LSEGCDAPCVIELEESKSVKPIDFYINLNPVEINNKQHIHNLYNSCKIIQEVQRASEKLVSQLISTSVENLANNHPSSPLSINSRR
jgi:hypothetical protein